MRQEGWRFVAKRGFDLLAAAGLGAVSAPVMVAAAAGVAVSMGRPVLFRQERVGKSGRVFTIYKFRTMRPAPVDVGPDSDEVRITPFGRLLRKTSIDELPQIANILRGDMSLIGPRPLLVRYLPRYSAEQRRRHEVLPGLTGWAQVHGRNAMFWDQKFERDVWYVDHWGLRLEARILGMTAATVLRRQGIVAEGHASMPEFKGPGQEKVAATGPGGAAITSAEPG